MLAVHRSILVNVGTKVLGMPHLPFTNARRESQAFHIPLRCQKWQQKLTLSTKSVLNAKNKS